MLICRARRLSAEELVEVLKSGLPTNGMDAPFYPNCKLLHQRWLAYDAEESFIDEYPESSLMHYLSVHMKQPDGRPRVR